VGSLVRATAAEPARARVPAGHKDLCLCGSIAPPCIRTPPKGGRHLGGPTNHVSMSTLPHAISDREECARYTRRKPGLSTPATDAR
jgi:hypothetical protein